MEYEEGWAELERLAQAAGAADAQLASEYPTKETIERCAGMVLLLQPILNLILVVTRERLTDDHWDLVKVKKEAAGQDREFYEHSLQAKDVFKSQSASVPAPNGSLMLLFRLGGLLSTAGKVQKVAELAEPPLVQEGWSERGPVKFCMVDEAAKEKFEEWLTQQSVLQE
ncbi:hypothetical protein BU25DRAFT_419576 [Macroventuria anomochaeta]|uniref:Uncharacterized protein n=1 Tax=Macroventuria anomochaeta TaxID=301207 RepID=A0ACB6S797_9PLEO|nr:uncharacterized protein BU25DRAFT_419576 [Macroventuria anomochaeta]KAF2629913.1 hypothetical protein BU25DRAFT_419576 [Macroventuria anomochaeta]